MFEDVRRFQLKYWPEYVPDSPTFRHSVAALVSLAHLEEEVNELHKAVANEDLVGTLDAIVDAVYVLLGLAVRLGLPFDEAWERVHAANMRKVRGPGKRGRIDVVKPDGWTPPDLNALFQEGR